MGAIYPFRVIVDFTDLMVGLMVIPNTIAILVLASKVKQETDHYMKNLRAGNYPMYK